VKAETTLFHAFAAHPAKPRRLGWRYNFVLRTNGAAPVEIAACGGVHRFSSRLASFFAPPMTDMPNHAGPAPCPELAGGRAALRED
jgi:hypothetical protein